MTIANRPDLRRSAVGSPYRIGLVLAVVAAGLLVLAQAVPAGASADDLQFAKAATARFNSSTQAAEAGYGLPPDGPLHECIAAFDGSGAMGFHHINGALLDTTIDASEPEALVYGPDGHGNVHLVALEYVVFEDPWVAEHGAATPELFGEKFMYVPAPNRYEVPPFFALHAWIWEYNPAGTFAPFNPNVACD
jgi:hypothetical protein